MIDALFDTNIIIYLSLQDKRYLEFVRLLDFLKLGISVISYMELMMGSKTAEDRRQLEEALRGFEVVPLHREIGDMTSKALQVLEKKSLRVPQLADVIIAQTALFYHAPLATNNPKDFKLFKGLDLVVP